MCVSRRVLRFTLAIVVLAALLALPLIPAPALARPPLDEPADEEGASSEPIEPAVFPDPPQPDQEDDDQGGVSAAAYIVNPTMNYQGFLTDGDGFPVNDTLDITVSLWDEEGAGAGTRLWGPEVHNNVSVGSGLFSLVLGSGVAFNLVDFYNALYLEIEVDATILPRQPLRGVPYAMTLVPGAYIRGDDDSRSTVYVRQDGDDFAFWAQENGPSDYGLGADKIYSSEGYASGRDSYVWVPGSLVYQTYGTTGVQLERQNYGSVVVDCTSTANHNLYIPIEIPGPLYGHPAVVEEMRVYYKTDSSASPIEISRLRKLNSDGSVEIIAEESDNQNSTTYTSYSVPIISTSGYSLTIAGGPLTALVQWRCDSTSHNLTLGGVRLRLGHPRTDQ